MRRSRPLDHARRARRTTCRDGHRRSRPRSLGARNDRTERRRATRRLAAISRWSAANLRRMIYRLLRPILFSLDAERAHDLAISFAEYVNRSPRLANFIRWWSG